MKNVYTLSLSVGLCVASYLLSVGNALAFTTTDTVPGSHNLYYDDWGHPYNIPGGSTEFDAVGRGKAPLSFGSGFTFAPNQSFSVIASGCTVDFNDLCTSPEGFSRLFRELPIYSLIGIWSSNASKVVPVEEGSNPAFFVGSATNFTTPDYTDNLYLFLATNDGFFADNPDNFSYTVTLSDVGSITPVPEPNSILGLFSLASLGLLISRNREGKNI